MTKKLNQPSSDTPTPQQLLHHLRQAKPAQKKVEWKAATTGQRISDALTKMVGSWTFIITQSIILCLWIILNVVAWVSQWDPYPFILLNLVLSFQAAFTAPIIMMSQNRQSEIDRRRAENDYHVNVKAELEIEALHEKVDLLRTQEIKQLLDIIQTLEKRIKE